MSRVDNCPVTANDTRSDAKSVLHNGDEKWRETEEERHSLFSVSGFWRLKMVWHFFKFQVSRLCRSFFSTGAYLLLLTPRHWWPKIVGVVYTCFVSSIKSCAGAYNILADCPAGGARCPCPKNPIPRSRPCFLGDVRTSYVIANPSVCLLSLCLSSVTLLHPSDKVELVGNILHHLVA